MSKSRKLAVLVVALVVVGLGVWRLKAEAPSLEKQRTKYTKAYNDGNWKVAYEGLRKLALDPKNDPLKVSKDLELCVSALKKLGRTHELDEFREAVVAVHDKNW